MHLTNLTLKNFRNHEESNLSPSPDINLIVGENAQGKTNLLEAVYCLSRAASFRTRKESEIIQFGCSDAELSAHAVGQSRSYDLLLRFGTHRSAFINGVRKQRITDFAKLFHVVLFCPDDLNLLRGGAAARRAFLDNALCQLRPNYAELLSEYNRLHAHIRILLKEGDRNGILDDFAYNICSIGAQIIPYRASFCKTLGIQTAQFHSDIASGEKLDTSYQTVSTVTDPSASPREIGRELWKHYEEHRDAMIRTATLLTGPHRDDVLFTIGENGISAREFASQGQVRTAAIAAKLAEREIFKRADGESPILLLDDVLSELDSARRAYILRGITGGQVFITSCDPDALQERKCHSFTVKKGIVY